MQDFFHQQYEWCFSLKKFHPFSPQGLWRQGKCHPRHVPKWRCIERFAITLALLSLLWKAGCKISNIQMLWIWQSLFYFWGTFSLGDIAAERLKTFRMNVVINAVPCAMFFQNFIWVWRMDHMEISQKSFFDLLVTKYDSGPGICMRSGEGWLRHILRRANQEKSPATVLEQLTSPPRNNELQLMRSFTARKIYN